MEQFNDIGLKCYSQETLCIQNFDLNFKVKKQKSIARIGLKIVYNEQQLHKYSRNESQNLHRSIVFVIFARNTYTTSVIFDLHYI